MSDFRTPLSKVRGHGSAKDGTDHFWRQRLTAIVNIPLILFFIALVVWLNGASHAETISALGNPVVALLTFSVIASALVHMSIGMSEIILDYAHSEGTKFALLIMSKVFVVAIGLIAGYSLLKLSFGG
jgi:succinate dehydrogenase / fumarate reductase, membrane anchor subunit